MEFDRVMRDGDSIDSIESVTQVNQGEVTASDDVVIGATTFSGQTAQAKISGGTADEFYLITFRIISVAGAKREAEGYLRVLDIK